MPAIPTDTAAMSLTIHWPNGCTSSCAPGRDWLLAARDAGCSIPTGCLGGSCGA
jgi:ferredoxin